MERTLVLSQSYEPLTTIRWKRAIKMLTLGRVEVVEEYNQEVRSVSLAIKVPAVVKLVRKIYKGRKKVRYSKQAVFARDWWKCQYCKEEKSSKELTLDHVIPRGQGGTTCWENVVACCSSCNTRKGNRTPEQARMFLGKKPIRPTWIPMVFVHAYKKSAPSKWSEYMYY